MIDQCPSLIKPQYQLTSSTTKFKFEGLNRVLIACNNTLIVCERSDLQYVLKQVGRHGNIIKQIGFCTEFTPEFVLLSPDEVVILVKNKQADYLVLWNLSSNSQVKLMIKQGRSLSSSTTLLAFQTTKIVCLIEPLLYTSQLQINYFLAHDNQIIALSNSSLQCQCGGIQVKKLNDISSFAVHNRQNCEHSFKITTFKYNEQLRTAFPSELQIPLPTGVVCAVSDLWSIDAYNLYIQLKLQVQSNNKIQYRNYLWEQSVKNLRELPNLSANNMVQWACSLRCLPHNQIRQQKKKGNFVVYFIDKITYRVVGVVYPNHESCYESFNGSTMISYQIDRKSKQMKIESWDLPPTWHGANITTIFSLEELSSSWDQDLLDQVTKLVSHNQIQVAQLIYSSH